MARTADPHSGSAQFFINVNNNTFLNHRAKNLKDWGYAVFGKVVSGMDVVNRIKGVAIANKGGAFANLPVSNVVIEYATIAEKPANAAKDSNK